MIFYLWFLSDLRSHRTVTYINHEDSTNIKCLVQNNRTFSAIYSESNAIVSFGEKMSIKRVGKKRPRKTKKMCHGGCGKMLVDPGMTPWQYYYNYVESLWIINRWVIMTGVRTRERMVFIWTNFVLFNRPFRREHIHYFDEMFWLYAYYQRWILCFFSI